MTTNTISRTKAYLCPAKKKSPVRKKYLESNKFVTRLSAYFSSYRRHTVDDEINKNIYIHEALLRSFWVEKNAMQASETRFVSSFSQNKELRNKQVMQQSSSGSQTTNFPSQFCGVLVNLPVPLMTR